MEGSTGSCIAGRAGEGQTYPTIQTAREHPITNCAKGNKRKGRKTLAESIPVLKSQELEELMLDALEHVSGI
eukprot:765592-Hanusia_phi.AAC.1